MLQKFALVTSNIGKKLGRKVDDQRESQPVKFVFSLGEFQEHLENCIFAMKYEFIEHDLVLRYEKYDYVTCPQEKDRLVREELHRMLPEHNPEIVQWFKNEVKLPGLNDNDEFDRYVGTIMIRRLNARNVLSETACEIVDDIAKELYLAGVAEFYGNSVWCHSVWSRHPAEDYDKKKAEKEPDTNIR